MQILEIFKALSAAGMLANIPQSSVCSAFAGYLLQRGCGV